MKTLSFLVNPASLKRIGRDLDDRIKAIIDPDRFSLSIQYSESFQHLSQLARELLL
jgi:hypothetical protein